MRILANVTSRLNLVRSGFSSQPNIKSLGKLLHSEKENYESGQCFIHKKFGYKGVILKNWPTKFNCKDKLIEVNKKSIVDVYQVLADKSDLAKCESNLKSGLTVLHNYDKYSGVLHHLSGIDYAFHEDILPIEFEPDESLDNPYLEEFFDYKDKKFTAKESLKEWLDLKEGFLASQNINHDISNSVKVTVVTFFMGRKVLKFDNEEKTSRLWRYLVRIEYNDEDKIQLRERFWKIFSIDGSIESINGVGVIGKEPIFTRNSRVFQYHSHVQINFPWAHMWGSYRFDREDGSSFDVRIPAFPLCDKSADQNENTPIGMMNNIDSISDAKNNQDDK